MAKYNLASPTAISVACSLDSLEDWLANEIRGNDAPLRQVIRQVCKNVSYFIRWAPQPMLLWQGCDRIAPSGQRQRIHKYPDAIKDAARKVKVTLDSRPNGPAIAAFQIAGGDRPSRLGSNNSWSIHHLYSGKFPYYGRAETTHASKHPLHFTQSAGLIAVHPIADQMCDEIPAFTWLLRAKAFQQFGYDPDGVFSEFRDEFGFAPGFKHEVLCRGSTVAEIE